MKEESNYLGLYLCVLYCAFCIVAALYTVLRSNREENAYVQIFLWIFSPVLFLSGMLFVKPERKKLYFQKIKTKLFTK